MSKRTRITLVAASVVAIMAAALPAFAATPAPTALTDQLVACQAAQAVAETLDEKAWAEHCVTLAERAIEAWQDAHPTPSPTPTATPTVAPTTTPPATTAPPTTTPAPTTMPPTTAPPSTAPPTPTPTSSGWPGPTNTGVPAGTVLTPYTGPCTITTATTITSKTISCGVLFIRAVVKIDRSKVDGQVLEDYIGNASITVIDSEVDGGTRQGAAVSNTNVTVIRSNIYGGAASVQCGSNCVVRDSWLHGQYRPTGSDWHLDGFITNGGSNMTLTHNTLACDEMTGGCTADGFLAADFSRVTNVTFEGNLFVASPQVQYCTYGGANRLGSSGIVYRDNVFQRGTNGKCGRYGVAIYTEGSIWTGNRWDDGTPL